MCIKSAKVFFTSEIHAFISSALDYFTTACSDFLFSNVKCSGPFLNFDLAT